MAIWCVGFCGMQWRAIGQLCDIPFGTLYTLFARWTRLGLWRRLLNRLILAWRQACGDTADPGAVIIDSRSVIRRRLDLGAASMAARRSRASRSISQSINTASRWRSTSRQRMSMTARASSRCCISLPAAASRGLPWAISVIAVSGCPTRHSASPSNPAPAVTAEPSSRRRLVGRRALAGVDQPLPPVEHHLRAAGISSLSSKLPSSRSCPAAWSAL